jgi:putative transposase
MCIAKDHPRLSLRRQCRLLSLSRSVLYYTPVGESAENLALMRLIDRQFLETPWYGSRQMARWLRRQGHAAGRHRVRRLMRKMRLVPIYQPPRTSQPHPQHKVYPYLLKGLEITRPHLHSDAPRLPLPRRDHGLGDAKGAGVAAVEHDGGGLLC